MLILSLLCRFEDVDHSKSVVEHLCKYTDWYRAYELKLVCCLTGLAGRIGTGFGKYTQEVIKLFQEPDKIKSE